MMWGDDALTRRDLIATDVRDDAESKSPSYHGAMKILRLGSGDEHVLLAGADLFDGPPTEAWAEKFLSSESHHLLVAVEDSGHVGGYRA